MKMVLDNAEIYYEEYGEGMPLLFLHGFGVDNRCFSIPLEKMADELKGFRRIYFDLPGMGQTKVTSTVSSTDELFAIVLDFIDEITQGSSFAVAGFSYGGYLARAVVKARKEKLKGMFLLCPVIIPDRQSRILPPFRVIRSDREFVETLSNDDRQSFENSMAVLTEETYKRRQEEIVESLKIADEELLGRLQNQAYAFEQPIDNLDLNYAGPVCFLAGRQDSTVGYEDIYPILEDYPDGELIVLNGAGHCLQIDQKEEFSRIFLRWLEFVRIYAI